MDFDVVEVTNGRMSNEQLFDFETDYLNSQLKSDEVRRKYGLSKKQYSVIAQRIRDKYGLLKRPYAQSKHFYQWGNRWHIIKTNRKERVYFGSLSADIFSREEIENIVEKCKEMQWNVDKCVEYLQVLGAS